MAASLDTLVETLHKSGTDHFVHTSRHMGTEDFLFQKGVFPYEYFTDSSKFQETKLHPKDAFFNRLTNESLTDADYERAHKVWNHYDIKKFATVPRLLPDDRRFTPGLGSRMRTCTSCLIPEFAVVFRTSLNVTLVQTIRRYQTTNRTNRRHILPTGTAIRCMRRAKCLLYRSAISVS